MTASGEEGVADRLRATEEALEEALAERAALWDEANRRRAAEEELADVRKMLDAIQASPSWRLTAPLRRAKAQLHAGKAFARRGAGLLRRR